MQTISNDTLTVTGDGVIKLKIYQDGNNEYNATEIIHTIVITKLDQTIAFTLPDTVFVNDMIELAAVASSGLEIIYDIISGEVSLSGNVIIPTFRRYS